MASPGQAVVGRRATLLGCADVAGETASFGAQRRLRLPEGRPERRAAGQAGVEAAGEFRRGPVVDRLAGGDHDRHPGVQQPLRLALGGAAVEEGQLQPGLVAEERGQAGRVRRRRPAGRAFEQQPVAVGMPAVMEDRDPIAELRVLEDIEDFLDGGVLAHHDLAQAGALGRRQRLAQAARLLGQVAQVARPVVAVVGEGQEDNGIGVLLAHIN